MTQEEINALQKSQSEQTVLSSSQQHTAKVQQTQVQQTQVVQKTTFESQSISSHVVQKNTNNLMISSDKGVNSMLQSKISPPRPVPVTEPMPTVSFGPPIAFPQSTPQKVGDIKFDLPIKGAPLPGENPLSGVMPVKA